MESDGVEHAPNAEGIAAQFVQFVAGLFGVKLSGSAASRGSGVGRIGAENGRPVAGRFDSSVEGRFKVRWCKVRRCTVTQCKVRLCKARREDLIAGAIEENLRYLRKGLEIGFERADQAV